MSYPVENQATMTGYRRTGDNDALEMDSPGDHYTQSRTLSANRGPNGGERSPERTTLLTPRDKAVLAVGGDGQLPLPEVVVETYHREAPPDRGGFVYLIMLIHGLGTLLPWNVLISSFFYWNYKLTHFPPTEANVTSNFSRNYRVPDTDSFMGYMTLANQFPNVLLNAINLVIVFSGSLTLRIVAGISVLIVVMFETLLLAALDSYTWTFAFVIVTLVSIVVLGTANGIYQNSLYGLAASFPPKYTNAVIIGNNLCGTIVALMGIMSLAVYPGKVHEAGVLYFSCALAVLVVAFATYFLLPKSRFYRFHVAPAASKKASEVAGGGYGERFSQLWLVFSQIRLQCWNVFFTFFVTLTVFPGVMCSVQQSKSSFIADPQYFMPVATIFNFAFFAFLGNLIPFACVQPGPKYVWIPVAIRVLFIPFFLFCNYIPLGRERIIGAWVTNDYDVVYAVGGMLLALSSGYFSSLTMMFASSKVKDPRLAPIAGQLSSFFLVLGIFCGLMFSRVLPFLITRPAPPALPILTTTTSAFSSFDTTTVNGPWSLAPEAVSSTAALLTSTVEALVEAFSNATAAP